MADITFTVDASEVSYLAQNVEVRRQWVGKRRRMADHSNRIFTDGYHLVFSVSSDELEAVTGSKDARTLQADLEDPNKTVTAKVKTVAYEVISTMNEETIFSLEYGSRNDPDIIECVTKEIVTDLAEFEK